MRTIKACTAFALVLGFAAMSSVATGAEQSGKAGQSGSGATGQSADGEKDVRNVGEAGGGGQSSGDMKHLDETSQQPASGPNSKESKSKGQ